MTDDLDRQYDWNQPPYGSQEMFDIFDSMVLDSDIVRKQKYRDGTGHGRIDTGRGGIETRNQSH